MIFSDQHRKKLSESKIGKTYNVTEETKRKLRLIAINRIQSKINNGYQITPSYNSNGCKYFEKLMLGTNIHIQHAENGGEYFIKELGYWVDGYDKINNVVYEYDEKRHFNLDGTLKNKDIQRQENIINFLKCEFIRIKYNIT